jgi:hypothetical protein
MMSIRRNFSRFFKLLKKGVEHQIWWMHYMKLCSETLPRSWTEGVLCSVYMYKKGDKLDCKSYRGICLFYTTASYPHTNVANQHYQAGFQSGESTTDQLILTSQRIYS